MSVTQSVETKVNAALSPEHLEVINESHKHNVPPGSETHFKLIVVSKQFEGKRLMERHRIMHKILAVDLKEKIHALALHTLTPEEWEKEKTVAASPLCQGGSKE